MKCHLLAASVQNDVLKYNCISVRADFFITIFKQNCIFVSFGINSLHYLQILSQLVAFQADFFPVDFYTCHFHSCKVLKTQAHSIYMSWDRSSSLGRDRIASLTPPLHQYHPPYHCGCCGVCGHELHPLKQNAHIHQRSRD